MRRGVLLIVPALAAMLFAMASGCSTQGRVDPEKLGPPPSTGELAQAHNQRVAPLETLWARVSVRASGVYDDGERFEEQGEGHLQILKPDMVSLTIGKLGETYFAFGANTDHYWSFDLSNADRKVLLIGDLAQVTPDKAAALGLPVHPAELIALSGIAPIDMARAGGTRWADDGRSVGISVPSRWGSFTLWIDPRTGLVVRSQAFDRGGVLIATAELTRYKEAAVPGALPVWVPGKIEITEEGSDGFVRIELSEPQSREIRPMVFHPQRLIRAYRIDETINLDEAFERTEDETEAGAGS
ncbi:MAG: hypothetical protein WD114_04965 [Phycisphaerales bacterium]